MKSLSGCVRATDAQREEDRPPLFDATRSAAESFCMTSNIYDLGL